jgi:SAM-dependent methyltransferase
VGTEAFAYARQFPDARVVGVDFSPRSIETATRLARRSDVRERVAFEVADLQSAALPDVTGGGFDLITCHGVLSYVPDPVAALRNFKRCLAPAGRVLLGVNGAAHTSARWRPLFPRFGLDPGEFQEGPRTRDVLRVLDSITRYPPIPLADMPAGYLAGDIFGPLNRAVPLAEWVRFARAGGLNFVATYSAYFAMRAVLNRDLHRVIMPRSRAELAELVDAIEPASFHQIVLSRRAPQRIPWGDGRKLLALRPRLTTLYTIRWPRGRGAWHDLQRVVLESRTTLTKVTLQIPRWEVAVLRSADGERSLREILAPVRPAVSSKALREAMYLLYQFAAINLLPAP